MTFLHCQIESEPKVTSSQQVSLVPFLRLPAASSVEAAVRRAVKLPIPTTPFSQLPKVNRSTYVALMQRMRTSTHRPSRFARSVAPHIGTGYNVSVILHHRRGICNLGACRAFRLPPRADMSSRCLWLLSPLLPETSPKLCQGGTSWVDKLMRPCCCACLSVSQLRLQPGSRLHYQGLSRCGFRPRDGSFTCAFLVQVLESIRRDQPMPDVLSSQIAVTAQLSRKQYRVAYACLSASAHFERWWKALFVAR